MFQQSYFAGQCCDVCVKLDNIDKWHASCASFNSVMKCSFIICQLVNFCGSISGLCLPVQVKALGVVLWEAVTRHLELLEADYFGLQYTNRHGDEVSWWTGIALWLEWRCYILM